MKELWHSLWHRMTDTRLIRRATDALAHARCRRHLAALDRLQPERRQTRILLGLIHAAKSTPFGRAHDFARIRNADDFGRLVPLSSPELANGTCASGLEPAQRAALHTALALVRRTKPQADLCKGSMLFLDEAASTVARSAAGTTVTCLSGSVSSLLKTMAEAKRCARRDRVTEIWPDLTAVLWSRRPNDPSADLLRAEVGDGVVLLETVSRFGAPVAVEDPDTGLLRWLPDHGVYFEFVPTAESQPQRLTFDRVEAGVDYELVLSSPAGSWACRTGDVVRFERRDVPLFHLSAVRAEEKFTLTLPRVEEPPGTPHSALRTPHFTKAPHPRNGGIPAAPPKMFVHSPWSVPADRG